MLGELLESERDCACCGRTLPDGFFVAGFEGARPAVGVLYSPWCLDCRGMSVPVALREYVSEPVGAG